MQLKTTHFRLAYSTLDKNTGIDLQGDSGVVSLREVYATARQVIPGQPEATLWAGQRYYDRHDIHINDFFWMDMSGYGTGVENVDAGFAKVSLAWIGGTTDKFSGGNDYIGDLETTDKNNFDLRLKDIETGIGRATFWLNYSNYRLSATELELTRADGWSGGAWIDSDISPDWSNRAAVQYGTGVAANFNSFSPSLRTSIDGEFPEGTRVEDQRRLRILDAMDFRLGERWSMQAVAVYQRDHDIGDGHIHARFARGLVDGLRGPLALDRRAFNETLELQLSQVLGGDPAGQLAVGRLADEDVAGPGGLLEAVVVARTDKRYRERVHQHVPVMERIVPTEP